MKVIADLQQIFSDDFPISSTRFRQKADFYSLLLAIDGLRRSGGKIEGLDLEPLRDDFRMLDQLITPESECKDWRFRQSSHRLLLEYLQFPLLTLHLPRAGKASSAGDDPNELNFLS